MRVDGVVHQRPADACGVEEEGQRGGVQVEGAGDSCPAEQSAPVEGQAEDGLGLRRGYGGGGCGRAEEWVTGG